MPFGLTNAPSTFQRIVDETFFEFKWKLCVGYLDDIIIKSEYYKDHLKDIKLVMEKLEKNWD